MNFKVYNGTQPDQHLCSSCCASIRRTEGGQEVTVCREMPGQYPYIHSKVTQCSSYTSISQTSAMNEYQGLAWVLDNDEDGVVWRTPADRRVPRLLRVSRRRANPNPTNPPKTSGGGGPTVQ